MSLARIRKPTLIILSLLLALTVLGLATQPAAPAPGGNAIALKAPSFVRVASAQEGPDAAPMGFPQDEAGISAYFKSASPVTLADVRSVYRVIEVQTADYIIGSVLVPDYEERYDVHLYVHRDGWFLAYYLAADPTAKIVDWLSYGGTAISPGTSVPTLLDSILRLAATTAGVSFSAPTYYDFRYPNATALTLVAEDSANGDSFQVNLPDSYAYFQRSWSVGVGCGCWTGGQSLSLDGVVITASEGEWLQSGNFTAAQLLPAMYHTIRVSANPCCLTYGALALTYRVP